MANFRMFSLELTDYEQLKKKLPPNPGNPSPPPKRGVVVLSHQFHNTSTVFDPVLFASFAHDDRRKHPDPDTDKFTIELSPYTHPGLPSPVSIPEPFLLVDVSLNLDKFEALKSTLPAGATFQKFVFIPQVYQGPDAGNNTRVTYIMRYQFNDNALLTRISVDMESLNPSPPAKPY